MSRRILCLLLLALLSALAQAGCPRIVSQSPYITHALDWLGLGGCIVGVSRYDDKALPHTGGVMDPDAAAIAAVGPQLMITSEWTQPEVWRAATPPGAHALRVGGFNSMAEVEDMLREIGRAAGLADTDERVARFADAWRAAAARVEGRGRKALLISSCGGMPYSFGRHTWLYDLFTQAGFEVVEIHDKLRHLRPGEEVAELSALVDALRPELIFVFERQGAPSCNVILSEHRARIVPLGGEKFLHPAPVVIEGLDELRQALAR